MKSRFNVLSSIMGYSLREMCIFLLLVLVMCGGCATGAKVTDDTFRYSYPKMEAKINPEFTYLGDVKYTDRPELTSGVNIRHDTNAYIFISAKDSKVKKILSIAIENISVDERSYRDSVFEGGTVEYTTRFERTKDMLDYGEQKLGRKSFKYYEKLIYLPLSNPQMTFLSNKGYILPTCVFLKEFVRVFGRSSLMRFTYCEDLTDSGYGCNVWRNLTYLKTDQKSYLSNCSKNCMNSFEVLK